MPYVSEKQRKFFNVNRDKMEEQGVDVDEWNAKSKGKKLPEKAGRLNMDTAEPTIAILQNLTTLTTALALTTREAHWNVKGPNFGPLHELFGEFYDFVNDWSDTLAERIVQMGGVAAALTSPLQPGSTVGDETTLIKTIAAQANHLSEQIHLSSVELGQTDDESTKDALIEFNRDLEKWVWKIESHLQEFTKVGHNEKITTMRNLLKAAALKLKGDPMSDRIIETLKRLGV
jgi:starvation-inducible DNA-binding protein